MLVLGKFTKNVKIRRTDVYIDNIVFRLHYRITFWFLIVCVLIVGSREYMKEHISCIAENYLKNVINTYCFFATTFTVIKYHNYYQWVPFVLFFQAILFYLPHLTWKYYEAGRMEKIVHYMKTSPLTAPEEDVKIKDLHIESESSRKKKILWLESYLTLNRFLINRDWAKNLVFCELLNFLNLNFQIYLMNGINWYNSKDTLDMVFPKVTKCTFHKYGSTGTVQIHDTICVMGLNIINEKIYLVLWFWILALYISTLLGLIWRVLTLCLHSELSPGPALKKQDVLVLSKNLCFSDWLFLYYLGKNMDGNMFRNIVGHISNTIQGKNDDDKYLLLEQTPMSSRKDESFC
ncbi:hypothetical protein O3M35_003429 [Rhynocoris fuscipes]|uniref:Innexin n=1 Tax=Rhynocoris fuscipes TaxID=488301 RepID=A0AAW1CJZ7_9HEMI